jgi:class 3 adenylate cyclase
VDTTTDLENKVEELRRENQQLIDQVRRLVAAENELYHVQSKLDLKLRLYRQLYEVSKKFNATFDLDEVLAIIIHFVLYELNFERCLVLLPTLEGKAFQVQALDGYYTDEELEAVSHLHLDGTEPALLSLVTQGERIVCPAASDEEALRELGRRFHLDEYAILSFGGKGTEPIGLLVAGNSAAMAEQQERVELESEAIISLASLANQATTIMKNLRFYQASKRFVPEEFLEFFQKGSIVDIALGDHLSKEMTLMFTDIRSFTSLSEKMTYQQVFDFVNSYYEQVSPIIRAFKGFIVKYLGDGIMAVFPNRADDALEAAITKLRCVTEYNEHRLGKGDPPIKIGVGLHTGHMMVGIVGEVDRMQGDAISDHVNLASRLEGLTQFYDVSLVISSATHERLLDPGKYKIRYLDKVCVKGKEEAIRLYEVFDADPPELQLLKLETQADLVRAQELYYAREFVSAQIELFKVLGRNPTDKVAWHFLVQAAQSLKDGVPETWTGDTVMITK